MQHERLRVSTLAAASTFTTFTAFASASYRAVGCSGHRLLPGRIVSSKQPLDCVFKLH